MSFARMALLHLLSPVGFSCSQVFTREEVNLYLHRISADTDGAIKVEGLPRASRSFKSSHTRHLAG